MADSILRLKVESQEYDNKLKQATQGLTRYIDECRKVGGTFEEVEKETLDYVRALGQMETTSRTATGKLAEMKKTFVELSAQYKQMTDDEKQSPFGKALAASLETLKQRAIDAKAGLNEATQALQGNEQSALSDANGIKGLTSALGINMKSLVGWGTALTAGKAALDVAKDAFFASESTVDEWGRTVQSVKGVYEGFLNAINTGDISGFLSRMDDIVQAAREAYDEMDKLGSMKTIQAPKISAQQTENERIRMMIQTGRYIAPIDGRGNAVFNGREMQNGDKLTAGQIRYLEKQLEGGMQKMVGLVENEVNQTGKAIDAYYNSIAKQNGMSLQEFKKGTNTWEEFSKKIQGYDEYQKWRSEHTTIDISTGKEIVARGNPYEEYAKWGNFRVDKMGENSFNDIVRLIQQRDQQAAQAYGMMSQAYRTMNRAEGFTVSKLLRPGSGSGKGGKGKTPQEQAESQVRDALLGYKQTIDKTKLEMDSGLKTEADMKKALLSGQERLFDAYGKAYATFADPKYKEAQNKAADEIVKLGGEVKATAEQQKKVEQAARELEQAQRKLTDAQRELNIAREGGKLKDIYTAEKKVTTAQEEVTRLETIKVNVEQGTVDLPNVPTDDKTIHVNVKQGKIDLPDVPTDDKTIHVNIEATTDNVSAAIAMMKEELGSLQIGSLEFNKEKANLVDMTTLQTVINEQLKNGLTVDQSVTQKLFSQILNGGDIDDTEWHGFVDKINDKLKEMSVDPIVINFDTGSVKKQSNEMAKDWQAAGQAIQSVGSALNQIEDPAAKVLGIIAQAVATMALSYAQAAASPSVTGSGWGWIAFAATGLATMLSSISAIESATKGFAEGGIVPGNSFSGDNTYIRANAGEVVLTRAQQSNLAGQLEGNGLQNLQLEALIYGEDLRMVLNRNGRRTGRGEYVQSRNIRLG